MRERSGLPRAGLTTADSSLLLIAVVQRSEPVQLDRSDAPPLQASPGRGLKGADLLVRRAKWRRCQSRAPW